MFQKIKQNKFVTSVLSVGVGNVVGQLISFISLPILSRIYSQNAYGEYGIVISTASLITAFAPLGLTSAIMEPDNSKETKKVFSSAFLVQSLVSTFCFIIFFLISPVYKVFSVSEGYIWSLFLLYIYVLCCNMRSLAYTYVNRMGMNKVLLVNPIIRAMGILIISIPLGFLGFDYTGFMYAAIISEMITAIQMIIRVKPFAEGFCWRCFKETLVKYKNYILLQCPSNAISSFGRQLPIQFISRVFGNTVLGMYSMCMKVINYPIGLIASPISTVYFRTASQYKREGKDLAGFTFKLVVMAMGIAFVPLVIVILYGEFFFGLFLGEAWSEAGKIASIVILEYVLWFCCSITSYCRVAIGRQGINLLYSVVDIVITSSICVIGLMIDVSFYEAITLFTIGKSLINFFDMILNFKCMGKNTVKYICFTCCYILLVLLVFYLKNMLV